MKLVCKFERIGTNFSSTAVQELGLCWGVGTGGMEIVEVEVDSMVQVAGGGWRWGASTIVLVAVMAATHTQKGQ